MRSPAPQAPGWYPDRSDSSLVRYWDGQGWTGRLRPRPVWAPAETELIRLAPSPRRRPRVRDRLAAVVVLSLVAVLAVGAVLTSRSRVILGAAKSKVTPTITSVAYLREANAACAAALGSPAGRPTPPGRAPSSRPATPVLLPATVPPTTGALPGPGPAAGSGRPPAVASTAPTSTSAAPASTSATLDRARVAAGQATAVHKRLAALPRQLAGAGAVTVWLTEWQVAADAAADYATALSRPQVDVTRLAAAYRQAKQRLDSFAEVNGLDQCRL